MEFSRSAMGETLETEQPLLRKSGHYLAVALSFLSEPHDFADVRGD